MYACHPVLCPLKRMISTGIVNENKNIKYKNFPMKGVPLRRSNLKWRKGPIL
jgi:hypothetical protein